VLALFFSAWEILGEAESKSLFPARARQESEIVLHNVNNRRLLRVLVRVFARKTNRRQGSANQTGWGHGVVLTAAFPPSLEGIS
jgi:hypothetical protein